MLRSIHKISSIANVGGGSSAPKATLNGERQIHVLKRTKSMLLGEYENERAEVVLRKALPSRRVMNQSKRVEKRGKSQLKSNASMGSHHSTVVPGYSYSPRSNSNVSPQWTYPPMGMNNGYFGVRSQGMQERQLATMQTRATGNRHPFNGAVYYNEGVL